MNIVMLEPLGVSEQTLRDCAKNLTDAGHSLETCTAPLSREEKLSRAARADALVIANGKLDAELIAAAKDLRFLSVGFTGVDHVDLAACRAQNVRVSNACGYATEPTAELALLLMLSCLRNLTACDSAVRAGGTLAGQTHRTLQGKTVGVVGTGAIGCRVAELLAPFGCRILGYARHENPRAKELGVTYLSLEELFCQSDIVSLHVPLTDETRGMVDASLISSMKQDAILINCARGAVVDSAALAAALNEGRIFAAGVDVYETEPPIDGAHPLLHTKNATLTPHVGFFSQESLAARAKIVFQNIESYLAGTPVNVIL